MKKKVVSLLLVSALVLASMTGCGKKDDSSSAASDSGNSAASGSDKKVELVVWESEGGPDDFIQKAGDKFTEKYPNITIKYAHVELGDSAGKIALDGPAGVGADVFAAPHDKLGELVSGGHILEVSNTKTVSDYALEACITAVNYGGKMYGYPVASETYGLFYNRAFLSDDQVPKTWEDLKSYSQSFNEAGKYPFVMEVGGAYYTILFTTSNNNRLFGADGTDTANTYINSAASVEGMKFFQGLREVLPVPSADLTTAQADGAFSSGNAAMHITGPWNIKTFIDAGIDFGVTTLPSLPGNTEAAASFSGTRTMFVSAYTDYPEEAALFAAFLLTPEIQKLRYDITGAIPSTKIEVDSPYINGLISQLQYAFPMPSIPQMGNYWDAMNAASSNIWDGADVQTELDACNSAILGK